MRRTVLPRDGVALRSSERRRLLGEILWAYVLVRWRLLRSDLPQTLAAARRRRGPATHPELPVASVLRLGQAVQRTLGVLPFDSRCLIRSLVLTHLLARRGLTSIVVFAAKSAPRFEAHAWVEHAGVPVLPTGTGFHRLTEM